MSGHNKWSTIKNKKAKTDAAKGKIFTKIGREIVIAVKTGGSADPNLNSKLKDVIAKAKAANMPNDNIQRSIKKAAGEGDSANYKEITYEGYAPCGVAVIVEKADFVELSGLRGNVGHCPAISASAENHQPHDSHLLKKRIRTRGIKDLIAGHHGDQILRLGQIDDAVGPAGNHVDALDLLPRDLKFHGLPGVDIPLPNQAVTMHHDELLPFAVVPVLPLGDAGL